MAVELIIEVDLPGGDEAKKAVGDLTARLQTLGQERSALRKQLKELQKDEEKNADAIKQTATALAENERRTKRVRTEQQQLQKELLSTRGSLNAQRAELSKLTRQYDQMSVGVNATEKEVKDAQKAIEALTKTISEQEQATGRFQRNVGNYAGDIKKAFSIIGGQIGGVGGQIMNVGELAMGLGGPLGAAAAGGAILAKGMDAAKDSAAEFTRELARLKAVLPAETTKAQAQALEEQALALNHLGFSAAQVVQAQTELAKAGFTADQVLATTQDTLNIAIAGQLSLADAATLAADTLTQFQLPASNAGRVADALAFGANKSTTSIELMGVSLKHIAPIANSMGVSLEETTTLIAQLAQSGFKGENATAALRTSLLRLASPSKEAAALIKATGTQIFDAQGKFIGFEQTIRELTRVTAGMTDEARANYLATILGSEATGQWTALITRGADEFAKFNKELNTATDGNGKFTDSLAKTSMDEYAKAVAQYDAAVEDLSITVGKWLLPVFAELAKWGNSIIGLFTGNHSLTSAARDFSTALLEIIDYSTLGLIPDKWIDSWYNFVGGAEKAAASTKQAGREAEVAAQKQKEATQTNNKATQTNAELVAMLTRQKEETAALTKATNAQTNAEKERIAQLEQEQYQMDVLIAEMERYGQLQKELVELNQRVTPVAGRSAGIVAPEAGTPPSVVQEISNARIAIAETEAETLGRIRREQYEADTQLWAGRLEQANKYAVEVSTIAAGLSQVWAQNEANQLAQAGDNEAKQLEIKRKFAKRQAGISAVQAVISGLAGAQKTLETLGLPLAIPFLAAQTAITAANVAGIVKNAGQFYTGGYTGDGGKYEPAGVVHKGEFVVNKAATQAIGVDNLYRMQSAATGYANGGYVNAANATRPLNDAIAAAKFMPAPVVRVSDLQRVSGQMVRVNNNAR